MKQKSQTVAFVHVNVIPMDEERVLKNYSVLVEEKRISAVGPADELEVPGGAKIIEGNGAYLMPGLADMHMHLTFDTDPRSLQFYLAHGVTTIRNFNATHEHFEWRDQVANGVLPGPTILTSGNGLYGVPTFLKRSVFMFRGLVIFGPVLLGVLMWLIIWLLANFTDLIPDFSQLDPYLLPSLAGLLVLGILVAWLRLIPLTAYIQLRYPFASVPETPAEARQMVRDQYAAGADFIKPYDWLSREIYFAIMDEAEKLGIYTCGHAVDAPEFVTLEEIVAAGQNEIAHADELMSYLFVDFDPTHDGWVEYEIDVNRIDDIAALMAANDVALTPTLITNETVLLGLEDIRFLQSPEYDIIRPELLEAWQSSGRLVDWQGQQAYRRSGWRPALMQLTKTMQDQGALLTLGTDVSVEGIIPGYSAHQELALLVEAGLTPFAALATGTRNAAQVAARMGADSKWGTITVGNRADLILVPHNPLEDVTHTQNRLGIMVRGQWFSQIDLDNIVNAYVSTYVAGKP
ncbi:MAG: amidohydrolase family protein [Anaerolineae bacterium]|nr:amidohydrolase family protein [Anaerolineae bacterium]